MKRVSVIAAVVFLVSLGSAQAVNIIENNSFETAGGIVGDAWNQVGLLGYRVQEGGSYPAAQQGDHELLIDYNAANSWNGATSMAYDYVAGTPVVFAGYYQLTGDLPDPSYATFLKIEFYENDGTTPTDNFEGTQHRTTTVGWVADSLTATSANGSSAKVKFTLIMGTGTYVSDVTNTVYWDNVSATPEPSTYALFALGFLGFIGAGLRRRIRGK